MTATRTIEQAVQDWFLNSPSWPFVIDVEKETADFMRDETSFTADEVHAEIRRFASTI